MLDRFLPRYNARFAVSAAHQEPAWRAAPDRRDLERICCFRHRRTVAQDNTIRLGRQWLQLLPGPKRPELRQNSGRRPCVPRRHAWRLLPGPAAALPSVAATAPACRVAHAGGYRVAVTTHTPPTAPHPPVETGLSAPHAAEGPGVTFSLNSWGDRITEQRHRVTRRWGKEGERPLPRRGSPPRSPRRCPPAPPEGPRRAAESLLWITSRRWSVRSGRGRGRGRGSAAGHLRRRRHASC